MQLADVEQAARVAAEKGPVFGAKVPFAETTGYAPFPAGTWPASANQSANVTCLRSVLMKAEHAEWLDQIWCRLNEAATS